MTTADELAKYLPYWQCADCGVRVFQSTVDLKRQGCHCDEGDSKWRLQNKHLLDWVSEVGLW